MQMDSRQHRILKASFYEIFELHQEAIQRGLLEYAGSLLPLIVERERRLDNGKLFSGGDSSGTGED